MASMAERSPKLRELPAPIAQAVDDGVAPILRRQISCYHGGHEQVRPRWFFPPNQQKELPE
jgi:hypothetical protein